MVNLEANCAENMNSIHEELISQIVHLETIIRVEEQRYLIIARSY